MRRAFRLIATTALALGLVATATVEARAGTTYTPVGGPAVRLVGTNVYLQDVPANATFTCNLPEIAGQVITSGAVRTFGSAAVDLGAFTYSHCTNPIFGASTVTIDPAWTLAVTGDPSGTTWPARVDGASFRIQAVNCDLRFSGTIPGTFDTAAQRFTPTPSASTMVMTSVVGIMCVTLDFQVGDQMALGGYFTNVPPAGSTPLSLS